MTPVKIVTVKYLNDFIRQDEILRLYKIKKDRKSEFISLVLSFKRYYEYEDQIISLIDGLLNDERWKEI